MPICKLTDRAVKANRIECEDDRGNPVTVTLPPKAGQAEIWDKVLPGFGLRVGYGGKRTYCVMTRVLGRQVRRRVGNAATMNLSDAREMAQSIMRDATRGQDSASPRLMKAAAEEARRGAEREQETNFRAVAEAWLDDPLNGGAGKLRSRDRIRAQLERLVFPAWGSKPITEITADDVADLVDGIARTRPIAANRTLAAIRRVFRWATKRPHRYIAASPAAEIDRPGAEKARERVLTDAEIKALWGAFDGLGHPFGPALKVLLLTGQRRSEVGGMRWSELSLEGDAPQWTIPAARTKNGREHLVPLAPMVRDLLAALPRIDGCEHVFVSGKAHTRDANGRREIDRPVSGWGTPKVRTDRALAKTPIADWRIHDLRRTMVTGMNEGMNIPGMDKPLTIDPHIVEAVVNHASGSAKAGVAGVYNRAQYLEQKRAALCAWAQHVAALVGIETKPENVFRMAKARRRA